MAKRPILCKQSHTPETKEERRARIEQRKWARDDRVACNASGKPVRWSFPGMGGFYTPAGRFSNVTEKRETLRRFARLPKGADISEAA